MQRIVDGLAAIIMKVGYIDKIALILGFLLWSNFPFFHDHFHIAKIQYTVNRLELYLILFAIRNHFKYCKIWLKQMIKVPYVYPIFANISDICERISYILHIDQYTIM